MFKNLWFQIYCSIHDLCPRHGRMVRGGLWNELFCPQCSHEYMNRGTLRKWRRGRAKVKRRRQAEARALELRGRPWEPQKRRLSAIHKKLGTDYVGDSKEK